jgi:cell division protein FtsW
MKRFGSIEGNQQELSEGSPVDILFVCSVGVLLTLGMVLVYSSSAAHATKVFDNPTYYLEAQALRCALGLVLLWCLYRTPIQWFRDNAFLIFFLSIVLLVSVMIPGVGLVRGGARRWISFGFMTIQPSELAKLAVIISTAAILTRRECQPPEKRKSLFVPVALAQIPVVLVLAEPDLGTALVIELIVGAMIFVAGVKLRTMFVLILTVLPIFYHLLLATPFRLRRLLAYIDPWAYRQTVGYQLSEALISIGSGGITGLGLGEGKHGLFFLPEAHTDFIFAILAQELGLFGVSLVLCAFGVLILKSLHYASGARTIYERYLGVGLSALIGVPALFNMAVVTGLLPTKGLPLPFISYGGSNLMVTLGCIGLILRIRQQGCSGLPGEDKRP